MIVVIMGPPGSGKGTQAKEIARRRQLVQLSTGDMLRSAITAGTAIGLEAKAVMAAGGLVADAIVIEIVANRINHRDCANGFVLDGFPRSLGQAEALADLLSVRRRTLAGVIALQVDDDVLIDRIAGRFTCANEACGEGYHDRFKVPAVPGVCDKCGGTTFKRRPDDDAATMRERLVAYHQQTAPLVGHYRAAGMLHTVDAAAGIDAVSLAIDHILGKLPVGRAQAA